MTIDGAKAATVSKAIAKRTVVGSSCTGTRLTAIRTALSNCQRLASAAATSAAAGTKLDTYFKSTTTSTKNTVAARLRAVASDCGSTSSATTTNCNDPYSTITFMQTTCEYRQALISHLCFRWMLIQRSCLYRPVAELYHILPAILQPASSTDVVLPRSGPSDDCAA